MHLFLICLILLINRTSGSLDHLDTEVEYQCVQHCPLQNRTDEGHYDYACDYDCNINQCAKGCKLWKKALNSSCQSICSGPNGRLAPKELYCIMGCNDALTKYFSQLKSKLLIPPAPALVADSLNATSLKLEWNYPEARKGGLTHLIQWKYEDLTASWHYCRNVTWQQDNTVALIENLQPYTKYRFRVALILGHQENVIVSAPSVVISTLPSGLPASPPSIVRAAPIDCTRISVSWEPGPFPHGPLLSYVLQITDNHPEVHTEVKDIPPENSFYMFRNLKPSRNYSISIRMRNGIGAGPPATVSVSTPPEPSVKDTQQPVLILGTEHGVIEQGTDIFDEPVILYSTLMTIKGTAIHISRKLLFISDSGGYITKIPLIKSKIYNTTVILSPQQINFMPLDLSVDWLNDQLYILGEVKTKQRKTWQITRCNLNGDGLTVAIAGLRNKPSNIEVDPYNGYLFWIVQGFVWGGLYRLDISHVSNGVKHEIQPELILQDFNLGAFTVDHTNFRLLVSNQKENTINSVSLDGKEVTNIRPNVIKSKLQKVVSLATANKKFYWTDGDNVFFEEYHNSDDSYFHNSYPDLSARSYRKVIINLQSSQPIPIPVNPPTNVQAIFGSNIAKISWQPPHLLGIQGKGAWQNWSYEIAVKEINREKINSYTRINTTFFTIKNLADSTDYVIKVAAYTSFGKGPWSSEFRGMTLSRSNNPIILWSASKGLLKSDATGDNVATLINKSHMKNFYFVDVTWYKDQIYLVTNTSNVHWYNLKAHRQGRLIDLDSVGSIAVDWLGKKLYWSNLKRQMIIRGNLNGTQQEPLPIFTLAKELNIDSVKAYLYWSTGYAVECAHLNGADRMEYHPVQLFSGRQVMGLTLDINEKYVYWIVRGSEGSNLFRAPMAGYSMTDKIVVEKISSLQKPNMQGPLCYFHKRLLWLQDDRNAAISDLRGTNIATISGKSMSGLTLVYVVDTSLHIEPEVPSIEIVVIPEIIDKSTIRVIGSSNAFNITWKPIDNVNYGTVFYEISIDGSSKNGSSIITTVPSIKYWQKVKPFTELQVAVRAFTYWGTSPQIIAKIFSPSSTPSIPRNLRYYLTYQHDSSDDNDYVIVTVRWDPPMFPNGVIQGYKVHCWYFANDTRIELCDDITKSNQLEYVITDERNNRIYSFNVQAFTEIGDGDLSETISIDSNTESPLPTLLIATNDSLLIEDIDRNQNKSLLFGINTPKDLSFLIRENKLFWINQLDDLMMFDLITLNKTKIIDLNSHTNSLTIDWLERSLYFVQTDQESSVFKIDLNRFDKGVIRVEEILTSEGKIEKLEVSPFTKKLYWIEDSKLKISNTDGTEIQNFFHNQIGDSCNCALDVKIEKIFTLDHSNTNRPLIIFQDQHQNILSTDQNGCYCEIIVRNTVINQTLPIERIKADAHMVYWTNSEGYLYSLKQNSASLTINNLLVNDIFIYGNHIQPYPSKECLKPQQQNTSIALVKRTATSLTLEMPEYFVKSDCLNVSMATIEYNVYYQQFNDYFFIGFTCDNAKVNRTFDKAITIENLKPFMKYAVAVTIRNYYTEIGDEDAYCDWTVFQTAVGVPSKPQNVSVKVLTPTLAKVTWLPPKELNGATVHYEIYWQTSSTLSGVRQKEQPIVEQEYTTNSTQYFTTILNKLSPNETYTIWVRAYSETNETSNDSDKIQIVTYPEPNDLVVFNKTAYILKLAWNSTEEIKEFRIQYSPLISNNWFDNVLIEDDDDDDDDDDEIIIKTDNLIPKTQYKFRFLLIYQDYNEEYIWPLDSRFTFETLGDKPSPPGVPFIQYIRPDIYKVSWEPSRDNGAPIEMYLLEGLQLPIYRIKRSANRSAFYYTAPSIEEFEWEWLPFYNGTETSWIIDGLSDKFKYAFRVLALNSYGWSEPSEESTEFDLNESARMAEKQSPLYLIILAICLPISIVLFIIVCSLCLKCGKPKKEQIVAIPRGPDVELATLRELPRRGVHNTNVLYVSTQPTPEEITLLPHIRRDQITLTKFLGSGAFGEVFEGKARGISSSIFETKVAVKTLRKGASDQEKQEFLQEAQLMSNFKHEHILQLLGVCLDNDPHFIIMELMQGGDLLTYLRSSRNPSADIPTLTLMELLKMCVDVAKGCRYLEEMHFVHRDLACRNCLVSSNDPQSRIVKIGDFGLARDIYKNDYYRKEGEGLLPVRWMAPESLVDGVFTSQSDVWAFGVLLWEIMTLGQQPYPARNNLEVLHYVRRGGRLGKPMDCPADLHNLMLRCWSFEPDKRPTFKYCLDILDNLHFQNLRNPTTAAHEGQYISTVQDYFEGISNEVYFLDENCNQGDTDDEINKEKTPFLTNTEQDANVPKYLELLCEPQALQNDGYEIPNQILQEDPDSGTLTDCGSVQNHLQYKDDATKLNVNGFVK